MIQAAFSITVGSVTLVLGWLVDRWSRRKAAAIMAWLWSLATMATGLATNFAGLFVAREAVGLGIVP